MDTRPGFDPQKLMEETIEVMKKSRSEPREDGNAPPKVGALLWKPDGTTDAAFRGEMRRGDHAEYTLLDRKHRNTTLDDCVLFATLEPCAPGARNYPKHSCAERIVNARIKEVWVGCQDPHPKVAGRGFKFLKDNGIKVFSFPADLQDVIKEENKEFFRQAEKAAEKKKNVDEPNHVLSKYEKASLDVALSDFAPEALNVYRSLLMGKRPHTINEFHRRLFHQGLLEQANDQLYPTGFGILLFAKHPRDVMEQAGVFGTIITEAGEDPRDFDGPMVLTPELVIGWIRDKLPNPISRTHARREEQNERYFEMVREGLVNALVHRDYDIQEAKIQLEATSEKVVIRSPGKPIEPVTLEQLQNLSAPTFSRNPRLHAVFNTMGFAEERGLGLRSMRDRAQEAGLPLPAYSWNAPYLDLTIYRTGESAAKSLGPSVLSQLSDTERNGWAFIVSRGIISQSEYSTYLTVTPRTAQRHLKHFVTLGLLRRLGSGPATEYRVIYP